CTFIDGETAPVIRCTDPPRPRKAWRDCAPRSRKAETMLYIDRSAYYLRDAALIPVSRGRIVLGMCRGGFDDDSNLGHGLVLARGALPGSNFQLHEGGGDLPEENLHVQDRR